MPVFSSGIVETMSGVRAWQQSGLTGTVWGPWRQELEMLERNDMILRNEQFAQQQQLAAYHGQQMPHLQMGPPPIPEDDEPSLFASILRHAWIVVLVLGVSIAAACVYLNRAQPLYKSVSKIYIEPARAATSELATVERGSYLFTQCELIKSPPILGKILELPEVKSLEKFAQIPNQLLYLREHIEAEVGRRDDLINVSVETPDPEESAVIVNALVHTYIADRQAKASDTGGGYLAALETNRNDIKAELNKTREEITKLKKSDPNLRLRDSRGDNPAIAQMNAAAQALASVQIQKMAAQRRYLPASPQMQELNLQEEMYDTAYRQAKTEALRSDDNALKLEALMFDVQEKQPRLAALEERIQRLQIDEDLRKQITPVRVFETGEAMYTPSFPKKPHTLALAGVVGLIVGAGLALLRDRMDTRLKSIEEVQNIVGLPILGTVPRMPGRRTAVARAMAVHLDPRSEVAESYRTIRTAIYFSGQGAGNRAKTLLVTSPEPGDGKTTSASNLAIAIAQTGRNILLLDADFRKPTQHKNLDVKDSVGLSSVLAGIETLDRAIQRTGVEGLDILPCGPIPENPSEILNSQEFGELIDRLAMKYDHILFDSPPANLVTDARILGAVCDATILVLRAEKSTRKAAEHARNALLSVGARVLGAVVNDVPRGRGYEVYGGAYYGTPEMRTRNSSNASGSKNVARLPQPAAENRES